MDVIRVAGIYATKWRYPLVAADRVQALGFKNTRLEDFEIHFGELLPRLPRPIAIRKLTAEQVSFRADLDVMVVAADVFLFVLPADQVVAAFTVECQTTAVSVDPTAAAELLDEFTDDTFTIDDWSLTDFLSSIAPLGTEPDEPSKEPTGPAKEPAPKPRRWLKRRAEKANQIDPPPPVQLTERHHIVYVDDQAWLAPGTIEQLVHLRQPRFWKEFVQRKDPPELNERGHRGVVTTNVSFIQGHGSLLEGSIFMSTVQAVGTLSRFRQIWDRAYDQVRQFRAEKQTDENGKQTRDDLEILVDLLGNLEFDLTFSVEFPLMRIESYHSALSEVLDLDGQANRLSSMFSQLGGSIRSEITAVDIRQARKDDLRRQRNDVAFNVLALFGVSIGVLLAFFGASSADIDPKLSMFNIGAYWIEYLAAFGLGLLPLGVLVLSRAVTSRRQRREQDRHAKEIKRSPYSQLPEIRP